MPPMAVQGPKPISICHISPTFFGRLLGVLFLLDDHIDAVEPGSNFGLESDSTLSFMLVRVSKFLINLSG